MAQKKVWISWVAGAESKTDPATAIQALKKNGIVGSGQHWMDDLAKCAWGELSDMLSDPAATDAWIIALDSSRAAQPAVRYGLSLVAQTLRARRGDAFPVHILALDALPASAALPLFLRDCPLHKASDTAWPAKLVAAFYTKTSATAQEFYFAAYGNPHLGQWIEVGPRSGNWNGAMLGVTGDAKITHHAVGPRGRLPERTVVEYPIRDMKVTLGETPFTVWAVQNAISAEQSYFAKIDGLSATIICGGHPGDETSEVYSIQLV